MHKQDHTFGHPSIPGMQWKTPAKLAMWFGSLQNIISLLAINHSDLHVLDLHCMRGLEAELKAFTIHPYDDYSLAMQAMLWVSLCLYPSSASFHMSGSDGCWLPLLHQPQGSSCWQTSKPQSLMLLAPSKCFKKNCGSKTDLTCCREAMLFSGFECIVVHALMRCINYGQQCMTMQKQSVHDRCFVTWVLMSCRATPIFLAVGLAHLALGLVLKLYFFQYWSWSVWLSWFRAMAFHAANMFIEKLNSKGKPVKAGNTYGRTSRNVDLVHAERHSTRIRLCSSSMQLFAQTLP